MLKNDRRPKNQESLGPLPGHCRKRSLDIGQASRLQRLKLQLENATCLFGGFCLAPSFFIWGVQNSHARGFRGYFFQHFQSLSAEVRGHIAQPGYVAARTGEASDQSLV